LNSEQHKRGKTHIRSKTEHRTVWDVFMTGQPLVADTYVYFSERTQELWMGRRCRELAARRESTHACTHGEEKMRKTHTHTHTHRGKIINQTVQEVCMTGQPLVADTYVYFSERGRWQGAAEMGKRGRWEGAARGLGEMPLIRGEPDHWKSQIKVIVVNVKRTNNHEHDQKQVS